MLKLRNKKKYTVVISLIMLFTTFNVFASGPCDQKTGLDSDGKRCYVFLEPNAFVGLNTQTTNSNSLSTFLGQAFNFGIAAAVVLALVMIVWGGVTYMTTDSWTGKDEGKKKVQEALYGLGLALVSYLILYTINPCTVDFFGSKGGCARSNTFLNPTTTTTK